MQDKFLTCSTLTLTGERFEDSGRTSSPEEQECTGQTDMEKSPVNKLILSYRETSAQGVLVIRHIPIHQDYQCLHM